jgi:hypothetical protein
MFQAQIDFEEVKRLFQLKISELVDGPVGHDSGSLICIQLTDFLLW